MAARNYANVAVITDLNSGITAGASSLTVNSASGYPAAPFIIVVEPDTADEELIVVGAKAGAVFSTLTRGFGGTTGVAHDASDVVKHVSVAEDHSLVWAHVHTGAGGDDTAKVSHDDLNGVSIDDHHTEAHTVGSHSDTGATGPELDTLTDGSEGDPLHTHGSAIHDDVAAEISAITAKGTPVAGDHLLIEDSAAGNAKKRILVSALETAIEALIEHDDVAAGTIAAHDTSATGAELNTLTDASNADALHGHDHVPDDGYTFGETVVFTASGSFVKASYPGVRFVRVKAQGGGGGGGGTPVANSPNNAAAGGGGGGGYGEVEVLASSLAASEDVTVGSGGNGGAAGANPGSVGGTSDFGTTPILVVQGGGGAQAGVAANQDRPGSVPGQGASGSVGDFFIAGSSGSYGQINAPADRSAGGDSGGSHMGGGVRGGNAVSAVGSNGGDGQLYGGGGSGAAVRTSQAAKAGGDGADGIVIVEVYY